MFHYFTVPLALLILSTVALAKPPSIPLKYSNQMPVVSQPTLSPDGKYIAVILNEGDSTQVAIVPFDNKNQVQAILKLGTQKYRIEQLAWANNERILVSVSPLNINDWHLRLRSNHN